MWVIAAAVCCCVLLICPNVCGQEETAAENEKAVTNPIEKKLGNIESPTSQELYLRMITASVLVCVLAVVAVSISRKVLPKLTNLQGKQIKVVETVHLGSRKTLHLIEVENRRLLIGSSSEQITKLAELTKTFSEHLEQEINDVD